MLQRTLLTGQLEWTSFRHHLVIYVDGSLEGKGDETTWIWICVDICWNACFSLLECALI